MTNNRIGDRGAIALSLGLVGVTQLATLQVYNNMMTHHGKEMIRAALGDRMQQGGYWGQGVMLALYS